MADSGGEDDFVGYVERRGGDDEPFDNEEDGEDGEEDQFEGEEEGEEEEVEGEGEAAAAADGAQPKETRRSKRQPTEKGVKHKLDSNGPMTEETKSASSVTTGASGLGSRSSRTSAATI